MNDAPKNDHGLTTDMQRSRWAHGVRYVPANPSIKDRVLRHPVTFFVCVAAFCACLIASILIPACGGHL